MLGTKHTFSGPISETSVSLQHPPFWPKGLFKSHTYNLTVFC